MIHQSYAYELAQQLTAADERIVKCKKWLTRRGKIFVSEQEEKSK